MHDQYKKLWSQPAWREDEITCYLAERTPEAQRHHIDVPPSKVTTWFAGRIEELHRHHRMETGRSLAQLLHWFADGRMPRPPRGERGVIALRTSRLGHVPRVLPGTVLLAKGRHSRVSTTDSCEVHPTLRLMARAVSRSGVWTCEQGQDQSREDGHPSVMGIRAPEHVQLFLRFDAAAWSSGRPSFQLVTSPGLLRAMAAAPWSVQTGDGDWHLTGAVQRSTSDVSTGPRLVDVLPARETGRAVSVWRAPDLKMVAKGSDGEMRSLGQGASEAQSALGWLRVDLPAETAEELPSLGALEVNVVRVEASELVRARRYVPARHGLTIRIEGLLAVESVSSDVDPSLGRSHDFVALSSVEVPELGVVHPGLGRGYVVYGDLLGLVFGPAEEAAGALEQAVNVTYRQRAPVLEPQETETEAKAFFEQGHPGVELRTTAPVRAWPEGPALPCADVARWQLVGARRASSRRDLEDLLSVSFPELEHVRIESRLGLNGRRHLAPVLEVRAQRHRSDLPQIDRATLEHRVLTVLEKSCASVGAFRVVIED